MPCTHVCFIHAYVNSLLLHSRSLIHIYSNTNKRIRIHTPTRAGVTLAVAPRYGMVEWLEACRVKEIDPRFCRTSPLENTQMRAKVWCVDKADPAYEAHPHSGFMSVSEADEEKQVVNGFGDWAQALQNEAAERLKDEIRRTYRSAHFLHSSGSDNDYEAIPGTSAHICLHA